MYRDTPFVYINICVYLGAMEIPIDSLDKYRLCTWYVILPVNWSAEVPAHLRLIFYKGGELNGQFIHSSSLFFSFPEFRTQEGSITIT